MSIIQVNQVMCNERVDARLAHHDKYSKGGAFADGKFCPLGEATVSMSDHGFMQADLCYEKLTVSKGRFFRLEDHFKRLSQSCKKFRLINPYTDLEMTEIFSELLTLTGLREAGLFWCVTRGRSNKFKDGPGSAGSFYAIADPYFSIANQTQREQGLNVMISKNHIRIPPKAVDPTAKNINSQDMKLAQFEAQDHGKDLAVLTDADGNLTEAFGANVFFVKEGEIYTPDCGCLEGITRLSALELAEEMGVPVHIKKVKADELRQADDAFVTSSAGGIMPINSVDGVVLGDRNGPGDIVEQLHNLYWEKMWAGWHGTPIEYERQSAGV